MNVVAGVEEAARRDRNVGDGVAVEWKLERQLDRHRASMRLREQRVDGEVGAVRIDARPMEIRKVLVGDDGRVVVLVVVLLDFRDIVLEQRRVALLIADVHVRPLDFGAGLFAAR